MPGQARLDSDDSGWSARSKHLKLSVRFVGEARGARRDAIWFGHSEPVAARLRLAYRLCLEEYDGRERVQMVVEGAD